MSGKTLKFRNFHHFRIYYIDHFNSLKCFAPRDSEHTIRVLYQQSRSTARFLTEERFLELFRYREKMKEYLATVDVDKICEENRSEVLNNMSCPNTVKLDATRVKRVLHHMSKHTALMGHRFRVSHLTEAVERMPNNTSSSFPDFKTPKGENKSHIMEQFKYTCTAQELNFINSALIATQWRTQINRSNKVKFRQFYPLPHYIQTMERVIFDPFFLHFEKYKDTPYAYSNIWPNLLRRYLNCQNYCSTYSLDIKGFDMNISNDLLKIIFEWTKSHLKLKPKDEIILDRIIEYHMKAKVLLSAKGKSIVFEKERGLLSGSTLTNLFGSFVSMFCILYYGITTTGRIFCQDQYTVHGDDNILAMDKSTTISEIAVFYKETFGLEISIEKSEIFKRGERIYFLGHYIDARGRYLNKDRMVHQLCFGSHYISKEIMSSEERVLSKLCSLLFKCTDGWDMFISLRSRLLEVLNQSEIPAYYYNFTATAEHGVETKKLADAKNLWMLC